jgi:monothiol glutaredoxin
MSNPIFDRIRNDITEDSVVLYMKGTPDFPQCGFSATAANILKMLGVTFRGIDLLPDDGLRSAIREFADWPTVPLLFIKGEFVGGADIMKEMLQTGELQQLLKDKGITP